MESSRKYANPSPECRLGRTLTEEFAGMPEELSHPVFSQPGKEGLLVGMIGEEAPKRIEINGYECIPFVSAGKDPQTVEQLATEDPIQMKPEQNVVESSSDEYDMGLTSTSDLIDFSSDLSPIPEEVEGEDEDSTSSADESEEDTKVVREISVDQFQSPDVMETVHLRPLEIGEATSTPIVVIECEGQNLSSLVDSGSEKTLISKKSFKKITKGLTRAQLRQRKTTYYPRLLSATGGRIPHLGTYILYVGKGANQTPHEFVVLDDSKGGCHPLGNLDALLGYDFMSLQSGILSAATQELTFNGLSFPLMTRQVTGKDQSLVRMLQEERDYQEVPLELEVKDRVVIPPKSAALIPTKFTNPGNDVDVIGPPQFAQEGMMTVEGKFCHQSGKFMIMIRNISNVRRVIKKHSVIPMFVMKIARDIPRIQSAENSGASGDESTAEGKDPNMPSEQKFPEEKEVVQELDEEYQKEWNKVLDSVIEQSTSLSPQGRETLRRLILDNKDIFKLKTDPPGRVDHYTVPIHLESKDPVCQRQYHLSQGDNEEADRQVETMLRYDIIEPSVSPWNFPIIFVDKKIIIAEGSQKHERRMCVDLKKLNEKSTKINFPMPAVDHTIRKLRGCRYFSCLDILWGFWQLPLEKRHRKYVAFQTEKGHYQFKRLPFGWVNSPFYFQRYMQTHIANPNSECCQAYIDDLVVFSRTEEEHFAHLRQVLETVRSEGVKLKLSKCLFFSQEMQYLGHRISAEGIKMDPSKLAFIQTITPPTSKKQVRSFLGKIQYYAKFLPDLSRVARPLSRLTGSKSTFKWEQEHQEAFEKLKGMIARDVMLAFPDDNLPFYITTDASDYAIGAVLSQKDADTGIERPILFLSKSLDDAQARYSTTEKELYAIMYALEKFHPFIFGRKFHLRTDHRALLWFCGKKNVQGRLARWSTFINQYAQDISFIQGKANLVADLLSRVPFPNETDVRDQQDGMDENEALNATLRAKIYEVAGLGKENSEEESVRIVTRSGGGRDMQTDQILDQMIGEDSVSSDHEDEPDMDPIQIPLHPLLLPRMWAKEDPGKLRVKKNEAGFWIMDRPGKPDVLWVPPLYREDVLRAFHWNPTAAHPSEAKMYEGMRGEVYWDGMYRDVKEYVKHCGKCQLHRMGGSDVPPLQPRRNASYPMQRISMDILSLSGVGAGGTPYILVIMDEFSRYVEAFPIFTQTAEKVADVFLRQFISRYGVPEEILSDQGGCFMSMLFTRLCEQLEIRKLHTTAYRPQGNGGNERVHGTLYGILRMLTKNGGKNWKNKLPLALYVYRNTVHSALGMSPFQALFGYRARNVTMEHYHPELWETPESRLVELHQIHESIKEYMAKIQKSRNELVNQKRQLREYQPGDLVKFRKQVRNKLEPLWEGPATVLRKVGPVDYELKFENDESQKHPVIHAAYLRPFFDY